MNAELETRKHISLVTNYLMIFAIELMKCAMIHDASKLESPEKEIFEEYTPKLAGVTYGSDEYKQLLKEMKPALDHHYLLNSHHPEYDCNNISNMDLIDIVEMLCDWLAATKRHNDGDINKSININETRFDINPQLSQIFRNTISILTQEK